jgi:hypothetical protein
LIALAVTSVSKPSRRNPRATPLSRKAWSTDGKTVVNSKELVFASGLIPGASKSNRAGARFDPKALKQRRPEPLHLHAGWC